MSVQNTDDIVDVLLDQHERLRQAFAAVRAARSDRRKRAFGDLLGLLHAHEHGEQLVVHPIMRDRTPGGGPVGKSYSATEDVIAQEAAELGDLGVEHPTFDARLETLHRAFLDHAADEERDEFPRLRTFVPAQRLHLMASELRNVQTMS